MTDHPVLIPTSEGAVGGIVSEPDGEPRAALMLLPGVGRPARSGINSFWARLARSLAAQGLVVLRYDCSREGETLPIGEGGSGQVWRRDLERRLLSEVSRWFHERTGHELLLVGACSGAFLAIELAGCWTEGVAGIFLIVPHLKPPAEPDTPLDSEAIEPELLRGFRQMAKRGPSWILIGEDDFHLRDVPPLRRQLGAVAGLEVEVVPGIALHMLDHANVQAEVRERLTARIAAVVADESVRA